MRQDTASTDVDGAATPGRKLLIGGFSVWLLAMAPSLGARDLWAPDEPRYAEVAREMSERNDWIVPRLNGRIYPNKPPLLFWLVALSAKTFGGFSNLSVRVPAFLAGLLLVGLTYIMGRWMFGHRVAALSTVILLSTYQLMWFLPRLNMDTLFASGVVAAIFCFYVGLRSDESRAWAYPLAYLGVSVSTMTKGPAALPLVLAAVVAIVAWRRDWRRLHGMVFSRAGLVGLAVLGLTVGVWLILIYRGAGADYLKSMLFKQNLGKMVRSSSHRAPFYAYVYYLACAFSPWVVFLPSAVRSSWRQGRERCTGHEAFVLVTAATMFVLMSASSAKRINYLMSLLPFVSLVVGLDWARQWTSKPQSVRWPAWGLAGILAAAGVVAPLAVRRFQPDFFGHAAAGGLLLLCGAFAMGAGLKRSSTRAAFIALAGLMLLLGAYASVVLFPRLNGLKSVRPMAVRLRALARTEPKATFATYRFSHPGGLNFYSGLVFKEIRVGQEAAKFLDTDEPRYCIVESKRLDEIKGLSPRPIRVLFEGRKGRNRLLCVTSREVPARTPYTGPPRQGVGAN